MLMCELFVPATDPKVVTAELVSLICIAYVRLPMAKSLIQSLYTEVRIRCTGWLPAQHITVVAIDESCRVNEALWRRTAEYVCTSGLVRFRTGLFLARLFRGRKVALHP